MCHETTGRSPGAPGQAFKAAAVPRIERVRELIDRLGLETLIAVDGGIDESTAPQVVAAGATMLVCGSYLFCHADGYAATLAALRPAS